MHTKQTNGRKYTHQLMYLRNTDDVITRVLASEHTSLRTAEKARGRAVAMSRGKLTEAAFEIVEL